jgi:hypothetical protein
MSVLHYVHELLPPLGSTYQAIDIRCVAIRIDADGKPLECVPPSLKKQECWGNVMAVVRLTYEDVATAEARIQKHVQRFRPIQTDVLRIDCAVRPFTEWDHLFSEVRDSQSLRVGDLQVKLYRHPRPIDLMAASGYFQWANPDARPVDGRNWPGLWLKFDQGGMHPLSENRFVSIAHLAKYADAFEAANHLCELNVSTHNQGSDVLVVMPLYATISSAQVRSTEKCIDFQIDCHRNIQNLEVMAALRGSTSKHNGEPFREEASISKFSADDTSGPITSKNGSAQFSDVYSDDDWLRLRLMHPEIGEITRREDAVRRLIPSAERNILLEAVTLFLKDTALDDLLVRAYDEKPPKLNEGAGFELHVCWLLGLFGFVTILLGRYEHIIAPHTKVRRSSVDILAANQPNNLLLVVGCTLTAPEAKDFGNLANARDILKRGPFAGTGVNIVPVLFTCTTGGPSHYRNEESLEMLPIIDADKIEILLRHLRQGEEERFFHFLLNPSFYYLGDAHL